VNLAGSRALIPVRHLIPKQARKVLRCPFSPITAHERARSLLWHARSREQLMLAQPAPLAEDRSPAPQPGDKGNERWVDLGVPRSAYDRRTSPFRLRRAVVRKDWLFVRKEALVCWKTRRYERA
jgi:hypothetical protein